MDWSLPWPKGIAQLRQESQLAQVQLPKEVDQDFLGTTRTSKVAGVAVKKNTPDGLPHMQKMCSGTHRLRNRQNMCSQG